MVYAFVKWFDNLSKCILGVCVGVDLILSSDDLLNFDLNFDFI